MKTWAELLPCYEQEVINLKKNINLLKNKARGLDSKPKKWPTLVPADVTLADNYSVVTLGKGAKLFADLDSIVTDLSPELNGLKALVMSSKQQRNGQTRIAFSCKKPVQLLVGYFRDDQKKYAKAPKLETDATANDYGQAEPQITSALRIAGMPQVNVHKYVFQAGQHELYLPKGMSLILGFTQSTIIPHDAGLAGEDQAIDWLFQ